jgi:hypothetical protein
MKHLVVLMMLAIVGCGGESKNGNDSGSTDEIIVLPGTFGDECNTDEDCLTGLCVHNDYAPFPWCSKECAEDKSVCEADSKGNIGGWCTFLPDDFGDEHKQLCLPLCTDIYECTDKHQLWKTCEPPSYKGNPLHPDATGVRVCQTPAVHGVATVDPETCEGWDTIYGDAFNSEVSVCRAYCDYLVLCQEVDTPAEYNKECCGHGCLQNMITEEGRINDIYNKKIKCYVQNFHAYQGTPQVCTAHSLDDNCSAQPEDTRPQ